MIRSERKRLPLESTNAVKLAPRYKFRLERFMSRHDVQWHWRLVCVRNGQIIATGAEGYANRADCTRSILRALAPGIVETLDVEM